MEARSPAGDRPRATVFGALVDGWGRALRAPGLTFGLLAATTLVALPLSGAMGLSPDISTTAERLRVVPGLLGIDATLGLAMAGVGYRSPSHLVSAAALGYVIVWAVLSGGLIDRLARGRPIGAGAFGAACGGYAGRFLRLSLVTAAAYGLIFTWYVVQSEEDWTAGATQLLPRLALLAVLYGVNLVVDLTKVRLVVEDRRSVLGSLAAAWRFVRRRPLRLIAVYLLNVVVLWLATGAMLWLGGALATRSWTRLIATAIALLVAVWTRLGWTATAIAFFQAELAHAQYTASPVPVWPDSAAVEAIHNLTKVRKP